MLLPFEDGYRRFRETQARVLAARFEAMADGCACRALIVTCIDGRVDPAMIFSLDPGACMILRTPGAMVPPPGPGAETIAIAIELAIGQDGARDVIVLGHSRCRAAAWDPADAPGTEFAAMLSEAGVRSGESNPARDIERSLVAISVRNLRLYPELADTGVRVHGLWFDIGPALLDTVVGAV